MNLRICILMLCFTTILADQNCAPNFYKSKFRNGTEETDVFYMWFPINSGSNYITSLCSSETGLPMQRSCFVSETTVYGKWHEIPSSTYLVNCKNIEKTCKREEFQHHYILKNEKLEKFSNHWIPEEMNEIGNLEETCLDNLGLPITRKCLYNAKILQALWEPINEHLKNVSCKRELQVEQVTYVLSTLYNKLKDDDTKHRINRKEVVDRLIQLLSIPKSADIADNIKISSNILKLITKDTNSLNIIPELINLTNIMVMNTDSNSTETLDKVNAISSFWKTIDNYFDNMAQIVVPTNKCATIADGIYFILSEFLTLFYINPLCSHISGVAVYNFSHATAIDNYIYDNSTGYHYRFLYLNQSLDQLLNESHLYLATYLPLSLWQKLIPTTPEANNDTILKFIIFKNDTLFPNLTNIQHHPDKSVLDITVTNYIDDLPDVIPFILSYNLNEQNSQEYPICGYWNDSSWITLSVNTTYRHSSFVICQSQHLGQFAVLITDNSTTTRILENVVLIGCALSFIGLICIWLAALFSKIWCSEGKICLNMSFILMMIMVLFLLFILPYVRDAILYCKIAGGFLQYNVIALFLWMAFYARVQYKRYVCIFGVIEHSRSVCKYSIFAYGIPLIPTCWVAYFYPETYMLSEAAIRDNTAICFPSGRSLEFGVILPVIIITLYILRLYIYMLCTISQNRNATTKLILSLSLFLLFGITWIFGIMAHLITSPILNLLFYITLPFQGFILFIYVIIIEKSGWTKYCCGKKSYTNIRKPSYPLNTF